jgi:hypothetical protein
MIKKLIRKPLLSHSFNLNNVSVYTRSLFYQPKVKLTNFRQTAVRAFSTRRNQSNQAPVDSSTDFSSVVVFFDADKEKLNILKYTKGKAGIYM